MHIIDEIKNRIADDAKYPVVEDGRIKIILKINLEFIIFLITNLIYNNITKKKNKMKKTTNP